MKKLFIVEKYTFNGTGEDFSEKIVEGESIDEVAKEIEKSLKNLYFKFFETEDYIEYDFTLNPTVYENGIEQDTITIRKCTNSDYKRINYKKNK